MFNDIITFLGDGISSVFGLFGDVMTGGIGLIWESGTGLTVLGELLLLGAIVGLVLFGIRFVRSLIPFVR